MFVKICGITNEEDALLAVAMGADAVGFVFAPSARQVSVAQVAAITPRLPPEVVTVGVFRDMLPARVIEIVHEAGLKSAQLHGHETPDEVAEVAAQVRHVIKAFPATGPALESVARYSADAVMIDAPDPGSGRVFDWRLVESVPRSRRLILAGGLRPENVGEAIRIVRPWGVDVSTGVESLPGQKDHRLVRAFVQAARDAEPEPYASDFDAPYDWQEDH